jgi:hypothetical protein
VVDDFGGPEAGADEADGAFHVPLLVAAADVAGLHGKAAGGGVAEERRVEPNLVTVAVWESTTVFMLSKMSVSVLPP